MRGSWNVMVFIIGFGGLNQIKPKHGLWDVQGVNFQLSASLQNWIFVGANQGDFSVKWLKIGSQVEFGECSPVRQIRLMRVPAAISDHGDAAASYPRWTNGTCLD